LRQSLTPEQGDRLGTIALGHVLREYPNKLDHVLASGADVRAPSALHPMFYGSFDWHSCVHGYWLLANAPTSPRRRRADSSGPTAGRGC